MSFAVQTLSKEAAWVTPGGDASGPSHTQAS